MVLLVKRYDKNEEIKIKTTELKKIFIGISLLLHPIYPTDKGFARHGNHPRFSTSRPGSLPGAMDNCLTLLDTTLC
jgi:hypothetical protein